MNDQVKVFLVDENSGKSHERNIHISNILNSNWERTTFENEREKLKVWIKERANPQHSTSSHQADLKLVDWKVF